MDWKLALKIGGPSVIAAWVFYELILKYLDTSEILKTNLILNVLLLVLIFLFCVFMGWLLVRKGSSRSDMPPSGIVEGNEVQGNEVGGSMTVGSQNSQVKSNKVNKNKVDGDLKIG